VLTLTTNALEKSDLVDIQKNPIKIQKNLKGNAIGVREGETIKFLSKW
jgi:hypothetical protein